jgi:hypothetical protein
MWIATQIAKKTFDKSPHVAHTVVIAEQRDYVIRPWALVLQANERDH